MKVINPAKGTSKGTSAIFMDIQPHAPVKLPKIVPVKLGLSFCLLVWSTRSLYTPILRTNPDRAGITTINEKPKASEAGTENIKKGSKNMYCKIIINGTNIPTKIKIDKIMYFGLENTCFNASLCTIFHNISYCIPFMD